MRQMENRIFIPVIILTLKFYSFLCFAQENSINSVDSLSDSNFDFERPQDFGLGKRVYGYLSEYKRYPVYSFGLGKRSTHLYNFGLGKRFSADESGDNQDEYDEYFYNDGDDGISDLELYHDDVMQNVDKRPKLYSFGLGKRLHRYDFGLGKRGQVYRYDFGLGKRSQPVVSRDKLYNFGLGKRNRLYSFGLGKRPSPAFGRFNFGLGKRSGSDASRSTIAKREIHNENPLEAIVQDDDPPTNKMENFSAPTTSEVRGKSDLFKKSPYKYAYDSEKPVFRSNLGFSRQFRKPLYSFGLGKRAPLLNKLAKSHKTAKN